MKTYNILFLCTHNSARSILGEALASTDPSGRFTGYSAGSTPGGKVNPFAAELAITMGYPADKLRSKSWDEFAAPGAPTMDFIITVCDNAAGEVCPVWPGNPASAHWGYPDPSAATGSEAERLAAFERTLRAIAQRIEQLVQLPPEQLQPGALQAAARALAQTPGREA